MSPLPERKPPSYTYDWTTSRLYELDVSWWGVCVGGRHYVGKVTWYDPTAKQTDGSCYGRHELMRGLSLKEAKELNPDWGERYWKHRIERETNRFETREDLERAAIAWVAKQAKDVPNWLLVEDGGALNPMRPIAARGWFEPRMQVMTEAAKAWDETPDSVRASDDPRAKAAVRLLYKAWYDLLTPPNQAVSPIERSKRARQSRKPSIVPTP